uniref:Uncharacterized protein n=1 Tax=Megaselia scalaris TaxID=36166 RepID=T1GVH7_MEGSC
MSVYISIEIETTATTAATKQSPGIRPEEDLLQWKDMPKYLQFNPYVLTGYRPLTTFKGCCFSLFYWHNETVNIFTHVGYDLEYLSLQS